MKNSGKIVLGLGAVLTSFLLAASPGLGAEKKLEGHDAKFLKDAASGGQMEVELGRLATQNGSSDAVKKFGQRMVDDHSKANDELKQVASTKGFAVPEKLEPKHQKAVDKLSKVKGAEFDREYARLMVSDHEADVKEFKKEAQSGQDADLKAFAQKNLPTLETHLDHAKKLTAQKVS